jgi:hypothetical protein
MNLFLGRRVDRAYRLAAARRVKMMRKTMAAAPWLGSLKPMVVRWVGGGAVELR